MERLVGRIVERTVHDDSVRLSGGATPEVPVPCSIVRDEERTWTCSRHTRVVLRGLYFSSFLMGGRSGARW